MDWSIFNRRSGTVLAAAAIAFSISSISNFGAIAAAEIAAAEMEKKTVALNLANLLRAARAVISDKQAHINDHTVGYKDVTATTVIAAAKVNYTNATGENLDELDRSTLHGRLIQAELDAIGEVMDAVQERINRKGVAFKGVLPAIFAADVAKQFEAKADRLAEIKLTAPKIFVRNRNNLPDQWENGMIEHRLKAPGHPVGEYVAGESIKNGRPAFRLILPEYYRVSCLPCHGLPKGGRDITGGVKEGGSEGDLGGAISVVIYNR